MPYEKCKIVLLPTNDKLNAISINKETNKVYGPNVIVNNHLVYKFHMYICTNKYIHEDDILYSHKENRITKYDEKDTYDVYYKVIASTDTKLDLPMLSDTSIHSLINAINESDEAFVEYKDLHRYTCIEEEKDYVFEGSKLICKIKKDEPYNLHVPIINENNTIDVYPFKNTFTFDEVKRIFVDYNFTTDRKMNINCCTDWLIKHIILKN